MDRVLELLMPYVTEILAALTLAVVTLIRAWVQQRVAVMAAEKQERENATLPGQEKKARAKEHVVSVLPRGARPFTEAALDKLVEKAMPEARKRVSDKPPK